MNTWIKNPQDPADEHDWTQWFADPNQFRGVTWNVLLDSSEPLAVAE